jgi:hypothetical protein
MCGRIEDDDDDEKKKNITSKKKRRVKAFTFIRLSSSLLHFIGARIV